MKFSLEQIAIQNFRGVGKPLVLNFRDVPPGLYFISGSNEAEPKLGSNGSGKSTLFTEALYWGLTGKTSRSQRPGAAIENWDVSKQVTQVAVTFSLDDEVHVITRTRNPNNLDLDGEKVEQIVVDDLLPLTDAALRRSLLIDQFGEMFLSLLPEAKSRIFSETLDLDKWIRASDRAGGTAAAIQDSINGQTMRLTGFTAAYNEARDQLEQSEQLEHDFEATQKAKIKEARVQAATAALQHREAEEAIGIAKEALEATGGAENRAALVELRAEQAKLLRATVTTEATVKSNNNTITKISDQMKLYSKDTKKCPECGQTVTEAHIEEKRDQLLKELVQNEEETKNLELVLLGQYNETNTLQENITKLEASLVEYDQAQLQLALKQQAALAVRHEVNRFESQLKEAVEQKNPFTKQCNDLEIRIKDLRDAVKEVQAALKEYNYEQEIYKFWQKGFKEIRLEQIDATLLELEMATNSYAEELGLTGWEIGFSTERETKKGTLSHAFTVNLYPPGQKDPIPWESYSGGEGQRWQLATAFGLSEVLLARSGIVTDFEVLDEPTHHLSPEGIDSLLACLSDRAVSLNRRIFLIDHHSLDRGSFDGNVQVVKSKQNGVHVAETNINGLIKPRRERVKL